MRRKTLAFLQTLWRLLRVWVTASPTTFRLGKRDWHLYPDGTMLPVISGGAPEDGEGDDEEEKGDSEEEKGDSEEEPDDTSGEDDDQEVDSEDEDGEDEDSDVDEDELPDAVKKVLSKERKARREAEKRAKKAERDARKKQRKRRDGDDDRGRERRRDGEDDEDDREPDEATRKLRQANLISALQEEGFTGKRAKAVARLLDDVEYDDDDEPTDLKDAIDEAEETYGKDAVRRSRRTAPSTDGGSGGDDGARPSLTADELEMAKRLGMTPKEYAAYKSPQPDIPDKKEK